MPKESESLNNKDNSSSKVIAISPNSHVEEVLISDEEQTENDTQSYETKLNEKLKDLDLYEEGMTIQQKEELLAVVVASWETAEEEKTRRQLYQDYMNASEAFCNDQIQFSFRETPELSNEASLLSTNKQSLSATVSANTANASCYSNDCGTSSTRPNGNFSMQSAISDITSDSSLEICETETNSAKTLPDLQPFTSREGKSRGRSPRRGRSRRGRGILPRQSPDDARVAQSVDVKKSKDPQEPTDKQQKKPEEKGISLWKPCLSPKDTPLYCPKRPWLNEPDLPFTYTEEDCSKKIINLVKDFDFARKQSQKLCPPNRTLDKPYHLTRRGLLTKKSIKPDKFDLMIGVPAKKVVQSALETDYATKIITKKEPFSRTSGGAFRYVKANRIKSNLPHSNVEAPVTRSGLKYGFYANQNSNELKHNLPEMSIVKDSCRTLDDSEAGSSKWQSSSQMIESALPLYSEVEVILDEDLPKFNNLRPGLCQDGFSMGNDASDPTKDIHKYAGGSRTSSTKTKNYSLDESCERQNHIANSSHVDNDSSNGSSVIDVETIVDDEIEEFVLKRKMLQEYQCTDKEPNTSQSKRLKKGAL